MIDVDAVSRQLGLALLTNDKICTVCNWLDLWGEECDPWEAVACVVDGEEHGFYQVNLKQFDGIYRN